jgi:hypothetical protein
MSDADLEAFAAKLAAFATTLSEEEAALLRTIVLQALHTVREVEGYTEYTYPGVFLNEYAPAPSIPGVSTSMTEPGWWLRVTQQFPH